jgi:dihydrodipicolinate synthase/N-acetylneuraminate lyase
MKRHDPVLLATVPLPWTEDLKLDEALFQKAVARITAELTPHVYLFGTAGEGHAVTDRQFDQVIQAFRDALPATAKPMVGIISLSLPTIVERIQRAHDLGFRDFQISFPSWGPLTDAEIDRFFAATCGAFPDCRFLHYNLPRTKRVLRGADYARIAPQWPNLVAIKMGGEPELLREIVMAAPVLQLFCVEFGYAALRDEFECGFIAAVTAGKPDYAKAFFAARGERLAEMLTEIKAAHRVLKEKVAQTDAHMDGAYDKMHLKMLMPEFPLRLLPPYSAVPDEVFDDFCATAPADWVSRKPGSP